MNGQERAEQNFLAFQTWATAKTDADFRKMVMQGRLNRGEISRECAFGRFALVQNPRIKEALHALEEQLRARGVLPAQALTDTVPLRAKSQLQAATDAERLHKLEAENARLRAELAELQRRLKRFEATRLPLVLITGGAGVGKTTVLKAVQALLAQSGQAAGRRHPSPGDDDCRVPAQHCPARGATRTVCSWSIRRACSTSCSPIGCSMPFQHRAASS